MMFDYLAVDYNIRGEEGNVKGEDEIGVGRGPVRDRIVSRACLDYTIGFRYNSVPVIIVIF